MAHHYSHRHFLSLVFAFAAAAGLTLASCSRKTEAPPAGKGRSGPAPVVAALAETKTVPIEISTFGTVEPSASVAVKAEVSGVLMTTHIQKGQDVKKGALLFTIDPRPYRAAVAQAEAALARDKVQLANAERNAKRSAELLKGGVVPQSDYDKAQAEADALAAVVLADTAALDNARLQLEHCSIHSPIDGRAGALPVDDGNLVKAGDQVLVTINQIHPIEVSFSVPQRDLPAVQRRVTEGKVPVRAAPPNDTRFETGELIFIDNAVDKATGTIQLIATFANEQNRLWPGQYVDVRLTTEIVKDAVVVPSAAVQTGRDGKYVFVIEENTAKLRPVTMRAIVGTEAIITAGLKAGERVVTDGQHRLAPGGKVEVRTAEQLAADKAAGRAAEKGAGKGGRSAGKDAGKIPDKAPAQERGR